MSYLKKIIISGVLSALALIAFMLENLFPPLFIVGGRIGIANFFVLIAGICAGFWFGLSAIVIKAVLGSIFIGNFGAILYSLPAGAIAYVAQMLIIIYAHRISVIAASVFGAVINACVQNAAFCLITKTPEYFAYMPYLALIGVLGGIIVGTAVFLTVKYLPERVFISYKGETD
nr:Gx transporter family protein [Clostridia bacterium]